MKSEHPKPYVVKLLRPFEGPASVFDIDGVLVDSSERFKRSLEYVGVDRFEDLGSRKREFWEVFLSDRLIHLDKPVPEALSALMDAAGRGPVVIITGRPERMASATMDQLRSMGAVFNAIIFRSNNSYMKDYELKDLVVRELGIDVLEAHDDSPEVCRKMLEHARRGVYCWVKPGEPVFLPPLVVVVDGKKIPATELTYEKVLREAFKPHVIEYGGEVFNARSGFEAMKILDNIKSSIYKIYGIGERKELRIEDLLREPQ